MCIVLLSSRSKSAACGFVLFLKLSAIIIGSLIYLAQKFDESEADFEHQGAGLWKTIIEMNTFRNGEHLSRIRLRVVVVFLRAVSSVVIRLDTKSG